ncbi:hypothetical protein KA977_05955 [Candidatus Dependentiae bacterium]|nr:hypothetical protein [Candidatus Dependentiae bacterium]
MHWTLSILTIPERFEYITKLLDSIESIKIPVSTELCVNIICNKKNSKSNINVLKKLTRNYSKFETQIFVNDGDTSISGGRQFALSCVLSPLMAFIDDDCTIHGDIFSDFEDAFYNKTVAFLGLPSYQENTDILFKPRANTPQQKINGLLYMPIQGMCVAGYTSIFKILGGFNARRKFWGEWTEFNLRALRNGYPSAYIMDKSFMRHWHKAPNSPTRNMEERELHVLWGIMCTALEYKAIEIDAATASFWQLIESRYLQYSFGDKLSYKRLFSSFLKLLPMLIEEWDRIKNFQQAVSKHKFQFTPFYDLTKEEYQEVIDYAEIILKPFKSAVFQYE